ncbi:YncE family protein [Serratia rhizosphaerae]|uniref:Uncharacterized protein n=1 Tax=Serratia rhizosphaerae TaxID=2597702 RepID=A0ABX6GT94_9GAMM|nr:hypothetical protein [Serratia rhizosphaerae]QHA89455.1 hypothetical protein FO014_22080 [Serratia rhizosphaerae]
MKPLYWIVIFFSITSMTAKATNEQCSHAGSKYVLKKTFTVNGRQGITTDGDYYFVSGTKSIEKYDKEGNMVLANDKPFSSQGGGLNHFGDLSSSGGLLYLGAELFEDGKARNLNISVYDADSLKFIKNIPLDAASAQNEISAVSVDKDSKTFWASSWGDDESSGYVYQYSMDDGHFIQRLKLLPKLKFIQGIDYVDGNLFITTDDGLADKKESDSLYKVNIKQALSQSGENSELQYKFTDFADFGEIEGVNVLNGELLVLNNRGMQIEKGIPKNPYPGYKKEISEIYIYDVKLGCVIK